MPNRVTILRKLPPPLPPVIASADNIAPSKKMSHVWQAVGNTVFALTGLRFEIQTSRTKDKRVTAYISDFISKNETGA